MTRICNDGIKYGYQNEDRGKPDMTSAGRQCENETRSKSGLRSQRRGWGKQQFCSRQGWMKYSRLERALMARQQYV